MAVYLTAGHNLTEKGTGTGAFYEHYKVMFDEAKLAIEIRDCVLDFVKKGNPSAQVFSEHSKTKLQQVINWLVAEKTGKDISIEFHFNASANPSANGIEIFVRDQYATKAITLASLILGSVSKTIGFKNRGVNFANASQHSTLPILTKPKGINLLIEICFISNEKDVNLYVENKAKIAQLIATEINKIA